jgi:hypothetical protein
LVQQRKLVEIAAARQALEQQIEQTKAAYEHQVLNDLSDEEKKVAELIQDLVKANQKTGEQILQSPLPEARRRLCAPASRWRPRRADASRARPVRGYVFGS